MYIKYKVGVSAFFQYSKTQFNTILIIEHHAHYWMEYCIEYSILAIKNIYRVSPLTGKYCIKTNFAVLAQA